MIGKLFIISGPSGVGKDTIASAQLQNINFGLIKPPSYTTRKMREGEENGKDYYFVDQKKFMELAKNKEILEYNFYNQNYYGTSKSAITKALNANKNVLLAIDVNGAMHFKKEFPDCFLIFIDSPLSDIKKRLLRRGKNTQDEIKERLERAKKEQEFKKYYNVIAQNPQGHPEKTVMAVEKVIEKELDKR